MFQYLTPHELNLIRRDYADLVRSPEADKITVRYKTWANPGDSSQVDKVYGIDRRSNQVADVTLSKVQCVIQIVHARDIKLLAFGVVEEGDALFYFLDSINMREPVAGKPLVANTLVFEDATGNLWSPVLNAGPLSHYLVMLVQDQGSAQVIAAKLKK